MATEITRPTTGSSIGSECSLVGAANVQTALSDDSDDSYVVIPRADLFNPAANSGNGDYYRDTALRANLVFPQPTPDSGALLKSIQVNVRAQRVAGTQGKPEQPDRKVIVRRENGQEVLNKNISAIGPLEGSPAPASDEPTSPSCRVSGGSYNSKSVKKKTYDAYARSFRLYEVSYIYNYVNKGTLEVTGPSGTLTSGSAPLITWVPILDEVQSHPQSRVQVKIFATPGGGWPAVATDLPSGTPAMDYDSAYDSTPNSGSRTSLTGTANLADGTYRAYVRVAQNVQRGKENVTHWTDWAYSGFTISVNRPGVPTSVSATADDANGRITLTASRVAATAGPPVVVATDFMQWQRRPAASSSDADWEDIRTAEGDGRVAVTGSTTTYYDYETGNAESFTYRVRAVKSYDEADGVGFSEWSTATAAVSWDGTDWWLKAPLDPSKNVKVYLDSLAEENRAARQGIFQPIGATDPLVVSDTRGPKTGSLTIRVDTDEEKDALDALIELAQPVLLQGVPGQHWDDKYVVLGDWQRVRAPDKSFVEATLETTSWTEVQKPLGTRV